MRVWYVPIEPLAERYSESWYHNIQRFFWKQVGNNAVRIEGQWLKDTIEVGTFLDINSTVHYKAHQLKAIAKLFSAGTIEDGDIFFFGDIEFWGMESVRLMSQMNNVKIVICGFLYAASYTKEDAFAIAAPYQKFTEVGWIAACDAVFVGSVYHKQALFSRRLQPYAGGKIASALIKRVHVTGNPMFEDDYMWYSDKKKNQMILPNRFDYEKRPNLSLDIAYILKKRHPNLEIIVTTSRQALRSNQGWLDEYAKRLMEDGVITIETGLSKVDYHKCLAQSKVMLTTSAEENFGYCIAEACHYDCKPVLERAYSHPELVRNDGELLFNNLDDVLVNIERILEGKNKSDVKLYAKRYFFSMERIWDKILSLATGLSEDVELENYRAKEEV